MSRLPARIMALAEALSEGAPIRPNALLHLGNRPASNQALTRLVRRGLLMRVCRGVYMRTIETVVLRLPAEDRQEFCSLCAITPAWLAQPISMGLPHG